jgi:hypothetical protein
MSAVCLGLALLEPPRHSLLSLSLNNVAELLAAVRRHVEQQDMVAVGRERERERGWGGILMGQIKPG